MKAVQKKRNTVKKTLTEKKKRSTAKKTFNEKLKNGKEPEISIVPPNVGAMMGGVRMLVANPLCYDTIMKQVPKGKLVTADYINAVLARKYGADWTCPMTGGIFINIVAKASDERKGVNETPYWRTLKKGGELNEKYPGGISGHKLLLEGEGHKIVKIGDRSFVENYDNSFHDVEK